MGGINVRWNCQVGTFGGIVRGLPGKISGKCPGIVPRECLDPYAGLQIATYNVDDCATVLNTRTDRQLLTINTE